MFTTGLPEAGTGWSGRDKAGKRQKSQQSAIPGFTCFLEMGDCNPQGKYGNEARSGRTSVVKKVQSDRWKRSGWGGGSAFARAVQEGFIEKAG